MQEGASSTVEDEKEKKNTIGGDPKIWAPIVGKVNEGSLDGGFDIGHPPPIDVAHAGRRGGTFGEKVVETSFTHDGDACLLTWIVVDEHDGFTGSRFGLGHWCLLSASTR